MLRERKEVGIQCLTTVELLNTQTPSSSRGLELLQKWTQSVLSANRDFLLIYRLVTPSGMDVINFLSTGSPYMCMATLARSHDFRGQTLYDCI